VQETAAATGAVGAIVIAAPAHRTPSSPDRPGSAHEALAFLRKACGDGPVRIYHLD